MKTAQERRAYLERRPWREVELPPDAVGIPTMLSKDERRLLYSLARDYVGEDATIVDAGCFLGGSTAALLAGLRDRPTPWMGPPLASYDLFRVEAYTVPKFFSDARRVRVGDSFRERFDANVARFDLPHVVNEGDISEIGWSGGPIDVLFLDLLKSWEVNDAVLRDFFPWLVPDRSVVIHQDYGSGWTPWISIGVELMRDSLVLIDLMKWGSHAFIVAEELPEDVLSNGVSGLPNETKLELVERAITRAEGWVRGMIELDRTELIVERDGFEAGLTDLDRIERAYADHDVVLSFVAFLRHELETASAPRRTTDAAPSWSRRLAAALRRG